MGWFYEFYFIVLPLNFFNFIIVDEISPLRVRKLRGGSSFRKRNEMNSKPGSKPGLKPGIYEPSFFRWVKVNVMNTFFYTSSFCVCVIILMMQAHARNSLFFVLLSIMCVREILSLFLLASPLRSFNVVLSSQHFLYAAPIPFANMSIEYSSQTKKLFTFSSSAKSINKISPVHLLFSSRLTS